MLNFPKTRKFRRTVLLNFTILVLLNYFQGANSAKILVYMGLGTPSHRVAIQPLATKLAEKGHEVTLLSPFKPEVENPKITEFCPQVLQDLSDHLRTEASVSTVVGRLNDRNYAPFLGNFGALWWELGYQNNVATLSSPDFLEWLENAQYDLVILEHHSKEAGLAVAHKLGAKVVTFSPLPLWSFEADSFGFPTETSWYSSWGFVSVPQFLPLRFHNELSSIILHFQYHWQYLPKIDLLIKTFLGNDIPPVESLIKKINLHLICTHFSIEYASALPPFVVPVGGMHIQDRSKPLPKNIENFISDGSDGFIYISFGSVSEISGLPMKAQQDVFNVIANFKNARFLIKWNSDVPTFMPQNVLPLKWFPQEDLLRHPKCRGFVSHGGLVSLQQAAHHGVPVVILPVFGDQPFNARSAAHHGYGIYLELADLTFDTFSDAIRRMIFSETLSAKAKEVAKRFKDRPMSPVDTAVWWTEYVLRHNDTSHLKPLGIHQQWWQRRMIDFYAFVFTAVLVISVLLFWIARGFSRLGLKTLCFPENKFKTS